MFSVDEQNERSILLDHIQCRESVDFSKLLDYEALMPYSRPMTSKAGVFIHVQDENLKLVSTFGPYSPSDVQNITGIVKTHLRKMSTWYHNRESFKPFMAWCWLLFWTAVIVFHPLPNIISHYSRFRAITNDDVFFLSVDLFATVVGYLIFLKREKNDFLKNRDLTQTYPGKENTSWGGLY